MFSKKLLLVIILSLTLGLLSGCGTFSVQVAQTPGPDLSATATVSALVDLNAQLATQVAEYRPTPEALDETADGETIRQRMLYSYEGWQTLWADAELNSYAGGQLADVRHEQVWVDQGLALFRVLSGPAGADPDLAQISNGVLVSETQLVSGESQSFELPESAHYPYSPAVQVDDSINPHPLAGLMNARAAEMIFPSALAQRGGVYTVVAAERFIGRDTLVVDWSREAGQQRVDTFWVDAQTGLVLRWQNFGKEGGVELNHDYFLTNVEYNPFIPGELLDPGVGERPVFAVDSSGAPSVAQGVGAQEPAPASPERGELYFTVLSNQPSQASIALVRLPAACVLDNTACPAPEVIEGYPNLNSSIQPLAWNPAGTLAAVAYPSASGEGDALWIYDPVAGSWTEIANFTFVQSPIWSPDEERILFHGSDGEREEIYVARPDGSELTALTQGQYGDEDAAARHFFPLGWLNESEVIFTHGSKVTTEVLRQRVDESESNLLTSGDGLAYVLPLPGGQSLLEVFLQDSQSSLVEYTIADGSQRQLTGFADGSLQLPVLSPDGTQVAFAVVHFDDPQVDIYTMQADGTNLRQVFHGQDAHALSFSPDGQALAVESAEGGSTHLFIVDLTSGERRLLDAPELRLDALWMGPSWRPGSAE